MILLSQSTLQFGAHQEHVSQGVPLQLPSTTTHTLMSCQWTHPFMDGGGGGVRLRSSDAPGSLIKWSVFSPYQLSWAGDYFLSLKRFQRWLCGTHILVQKGTTTVMHYLNSTRGSRSRSLYLKVWEIKQWCLWSRISLSVVHISGPDNVKAIASFIVKSTILTDWDTRMISGPQGDFPSLRNVGPAYSRPLHHSAEQQGLPILFLLGIGELPADGLVQMSIVCVSLSAPPVPCSSQGGSGGGSGHCDSTMVAPKRMDSLVLQLPVDLPVLPEHDSLLLGLDGSVCPDLGKLRLATCRLGRSLRSALREVAATISAVAHRPSTQNLYHAKWWSSWRWCFRWEKDPLYPSIRTVLSYLQHLRHLNTPLFLPVLLPLVHVRTKLTEGRWIIILWWLKGYLAKIYQNPLWRSLFPLLEPFEPLCHAMPKDLTLKDLFLLAPAFTHGVSEIHALALIPP